MENLIELYHNATAFSLDREGEQLSRYHTKEEVKDAGLIITRVKGSS